MGLRFDPIGGGQFKQLVAGMIEAEKAPIKGLETRKKGEEAKLKLFQDFKAKFGGVDKALAELSSFTKLRELKVDVGDAANFISVSVDKEKAQPGVYTIQVDELAAKTSAISNNFQSAEEPTLGMGFITMNMPDGTSSEIFVDEDKASLNGIAGIINMQKDSPVRAAVVKDAAEPEAPWKLIITGKKEGVANQIEFPQFYFLDGADDFYISTDREAKNARVTIDGFPIEQESNEIPNFLPGVTMKLKQARPEQPFTISITEDHQKVAAKIKELVTQVNGVLGFINSQNQIDEKSETKNTFAGDTSLQVIEYRVRNLLHEGFPVPLKNTDASEDDENAYRMVHLSQVGVEFDKSGQLSFKEDKFTKALEADFDGIAEAITGEFGFAKQLKDTMAGYSNPVGGVLQTREKALRERIKQIDKQIEDKTRVVERKSQALTDQFSRLQSTLSNLQRQQSYLSATMGGGGGGGNMVQQLLGG